MHIGLDRNSNYNPPPPPPLGLNNARMSDCFVQAKSSSSSSSSHFARSRTTVRSPYSTALVLSNGKTVNDQEKQRK